MIELRSHSDLRQASPAHLEWPGADLPGRTRERRACFEAACMRYEMAMARGALQVDRLARLTEMRAEREERARLGVEVARMRRAGWTTDELAEIGLRGFA